MTSVEDRLRSVLRDLPPEPPDELGRPAVAGRLGRAMHRRRVVAAVLVPAVLVAGLAGVAGSLADRDRGHESGWTTGGPYVPMPDWPRRGDVVDPAVDRAAVAAWDARLRAANVRRVGVPSVLYAGGGDRLVVVLHGVAERGGERLVVVTGTAGRLAVYADRPAPPPDHGGISVVLDEPEPLPFDNSLPCDADPAYPETSKSRILVVGSPGTRRAEWQIGGLLPPRCADAGSATTPWQDIPLRDGAGLVDARLGRRGSVDVHVQGVPRGVSGTPTVTRYTGLGTYRGVEIEGAPTTVNGSPVLPWSYRTDGSRARELGDRLTIRLPGRRICPPVWSGSLPDGTPVSFCAASSPDGERTAVLVAEDAEHRLRLYLGDVRLDPVPAAYAVVVDGFDGRWLVVIGPPELRSATLVDGTERRNVPLEVGGGFLRLTKEPSPDAYVTTPDFAADGGFAIHDRAGDLLEED